LAVRRQISPMAQTAVATNLLQPLNIHTNLTSQIALDHVITVNDFTQAGHFRLRQILDPRIRVNISRF
jgi:hypothetical protein